LDTESVARTKLAMMNGALGFVLSAKMRSEYGKEGGVPQRFDGLYVPTA
jgi:hypothetical protein